MNKDPKKYVFVGNREYVLREMIRMNLNIEAVFVIENSYLHNRLLDDEFIKYTVISSKKQLLNSLSVLDYDVLVSNGCKYILPIDSMRKAVYINLHPSLLPDLKGMDPVNGACLFKRTPGASCHLIDMGIDTGFIISRVSIPLTEDIDSIILFQLCFKAEVIAFKEAYIRNYKPMEPQPVKEDAIYYSITPSDMYLQFSRGVDYVLNQSKAFGYSTKGLYFRCRGEIYKCFSVSEIVNPFVLKIAEGYKDLVVFMSVDRDVLFKLNDRVLRIGQIVLNDRMIHENDLLEQIEVFEKLS